MHDSFYITTLVIIGVKILQSHFSDIERTNKQTFPFITHISESPNYTPSS